MSEKYFTISTESCADIFRSEMQDKDISFIYMKYVLGDRECETLYNSADEVAEFYARLREGIMPTTSQINPNEYLEYFSALLKQKNTDIVHFSLSSGLSNSYNNACVAADELNSLGGNRVFVVDSLTATQGLAMLVCDAVKMREAGLGAREVFEASEREKLYIYHWIAVSDLFHLKRGGRVSAAGAAVGTLLQISPVLVFDASGKLLVISKAKGKSGIVKLFSRLTQRTIGASKQFYMANTDTAALSDLMEDELKSVYPDCQIKKGFIGPVVGAHTGCGTFGLVFKGEKPRI